MSYHISVTLPNPNPNVQRDRPQNTTASESDSQASASAKPLLKSVRKFLFESSFDSSSTVTTEVRESESVFSSRSARPRPATVTNRFSMLNLSDDDSDPEPDEETASQPHSKPQSGLASLSQHQIQSELASHSQSTARLHRLIQECGRIFFTSTIQHALSEHSSYALHAQLYSANGSELSELLFMWANSHVLWCRNLLKSAIELNVFGVENGIGNDQDNVSGTASISVHVNGHGSSSDDEDESNAIRQLPLNHRRDLKYQLSKYGFKKRKKSKSKYDTAAVRGFIVVWEEFLQA